jgi:CubicO group peptidase (beta-lactamase class C family)
MTKPRLFLVASLLAVGAGTAHPQSGNPHSANLKYGFAPDRLARIDGWMQAYVDSNRIGGAVLLVMRDSNVVYERAVGWADREARRRMTPSAMFRIASQTKGLTSVAAMMLVEEGKLSLSDPVSRFIPAYANTRVMLQDGSTMPARRPITIRDLITHTAGISYGTERPLVQSWNARGFGAGTGFVFYSADKDEPVCATMEALATVPFPVHPGEAWVYGWSTDILGCVVERASGMPLDRFFATRITEPLGMRDTHFFVPAAKRNRLVAVYASQNGRAVRAPDGEIGQGHYVDGPRKNFSGGAGLVSTAHDYARFLRMLLNEGQLDGRRILSATSVRAMSIDQVGALYTRGPGRRFGLGFEVFDQPGANGLAPVGSYGWGGAYSSSYLVDPANRVVMSFMLNQIPNQTDMRDKVIDMVYQALVK